LKEASYVGMTRRTEAREKWSSWIYQDLPESREVTMKPLTILGASSFFWKLRERVWVNWRPALRTKVVV